MSTYREILAQHGVVVAFTKGVSMRPLIWQGQHSVGVVPLVNPVVGDMLLFEQQRKGETVHVLHRLIRIDGDTFVTRGDNCLRVERLRRPDIIGVATDIYRVGPKRWYHAIKSEHINIADKAYRRYVWWLKASWPLRWAYYHLRGLAYPPLRYLYHKFCKK